MHHQAGTCTSCDWQTPFLRLLVRAGSYDTNGSTVDFLTISFKSQDETVGLWQLPKCLLTRGCIRLVWYFDRQGHKYSVIHSIHRIYRCKYKGLERKDEQRQQLRSCQMNNFYLLPEIICNFPSQVWINQIIQEWGPTRMPLLFPSLKHLSPLQSRCKQGLR